MTLPHHSIYAYLKFNVSYDSQVIFKTAYFTKYQLSSFFLKSDLIF